MRTDDIRHQILQDDVDNLLKQMDFDTFAAAYHDVMPKELSDRLRFLDTPSGLYLRARADRMAIHKKHPICFEWEIKTRHPKTKRSNWAIEALPLAHHIFKARLGVWILYCYRDTTLGIDAGFWCHALPRISCVMMTPRGDGIEGYLKTAFSSEFLGYNVPFNYTGSNYGSGDPFVLIEEPQVRKLSHWNMEIASVLPKPEIELQTVG